MQVMNIGLGTIEHRQHQFERLLLELIDKAEYEVRILLRVTQVDAHVAVGFLGGASGLCGCWHESPFQELHECAVAVPDDHVACKLSKSNCLSNIDRIALRNIGHAGFVRRHFGGPMTR